MQQDMGEVEVGVKGLVEVNSELVNLNPQYLNLVTDNRVLSNLIHLNRQPGLNISNNRPSKIIPKIKLKPPRDSQNNNDDKKIKPIIPKPKPKPDEKKKEIRLDIPGSDPDKDDRPKTGVTTEVNKAKDEGASIFGSLNYNMGLSQPSSLMVNTNNEQQS